MVRFNHSYKRVSHLRVIDDDNLDYDMDYINYDDYGDVDDDDDDDEGHQTYYWRTWDLFASW